MFCCRRRDLTPKEGEKERRLKTTIRRRRKRRRLVIAIRNQGNMALPAAAARKREKLEEVDKVINLPWQQACNQ
jgi:hypothetical protein